MDFKDYYSALGVERTASEDEVRKSYRKLARKYHPDVSKEADAETRMRDINEAYDVLRDKEKRAAYDALAERVARGQGTGAAAGAGGFQPPPGWDQGYEFHRGPNAGPADHADFSEFFSSMFGAAEHRESARRSTRARGEDHHAAIEITLEDALNGGEREISLRAMEADAQGQPDWVTRTLSVKIPPGVHPGQFIRLARQGLPGHGGEPAGDLYLEVRIAPHKLYRIEGRDLIMTLPVTPTEAALGAQVEVPTPTGSVVEVTVPPNARGGMKLRLKERGFPGKPAGHLYLLLEIALPPADSDAARAAYQQLAQAAPFDPRRHLGHQGAGA
ncbi:MAG: DnaJ C-terminal domain-containing protein [Burkholderiaceae bacterium]